MSHEISRMFATVEEARNAAAELAEEGFDEVHVVATPSKPDTPVSAIAAQIALGNVLLSDARVYAEGVAEGGTLVTVHAPFGSGMKATAILDSYNPIPTGMPDPVPPKIWDEGVPFSSAMHMPLLSDDPTPASRYMGIKPLTGSDCGLSSMIGLPMLSDNATPLSSAIGLPSLSGNPTPLSSLLKLPLLRELRRKGQ